YRIQIIENSKNLHFLINPCMSQSGSSQHCKEYSCRCWSGISTKKEGLFPCISILPYPHLRRCNSKQLIQCHQNPWECGSTHRNTIIERIAAPVFFIQLKLTANIYHYEGKRDIEQRI